MSPLDQLKAYAQKIRLTYKGKRLDDIDGDDGLDYLRDVVDWTNMLLDELETETGPDGMPVDWWFARQPDFGFGTVATGGASVAIPKTVGRLVTEANRVVQIKQGDSVISRWQVVNPRDITNKDDRVIDDMCAVVGANIVFSRAFNTSENGGTVTGDVILTMPRMAINDTGTAIAPTNIKILGFVIPQQLLILGVAKNATLPDIVQGKLSPSYVQKYSDLVNGAITRSMATSISAQQSRDYYGNVRGVY